MTTYWERLKPEMDAREWGITELAAALKVSFQAIAKVRDGGSLGSENNFKAAQLFGLDPEWLARGKKPKSPLQNQNSIATQQVPTYESNLASEKNTPNTPPSKNGQNVSIKQYDTGGSMGRGLRLVDQPGTIKSWSVDKQWIRMNVKHHTSDENLCIVTGFGDSMLGMYNPGDPLLVDKGVTTCEFDGVYFFRVGDEGFIKRLQRIPGEGVRVISENPSYRDWTIKEGMDFHVLAKVLKVWESKQF